MFPLFTFYLFLSHSLIVNPNTFLLCSPQPVIPASLWRGTIFVFTFYFCLFTFFPKPSTVTCHSERKRKISSPQYASFTTHTFRLSRNNISHLFKYLQAPISEERSNCCYLCSTTILWTKTFITITIFCENYKDGQRCIKIICRVGSLPHRFIRTMLYYNNYDNQVLNTTYSDGTFLQLFVYGNYIDEVLETIGGYGPTLGLYLHDHLYSPVAMLNNMDGSLLERYEYDAYGNYYVEQPDFTVKQQLYSDYDNTFFFTADRSMSLGATLISKSSTTATAITTPA